MNVQMETLSVMRMQFAIMNWATTSVDVEVLIKEVVLNVIMIWIVIRVV